jgi:Tol biopolymer transport system component
MMFGGTFGQQVKSSTFFSLPKWFKIGAISYLSDEWNVDYDNHVRDGILSGRYRKLNNLEGMDAVYAGHSLWRFVAVKFGKSAVSNIIHMASISNSIDKGFTYVLGMSFNMVVKEWRSFYQEEYAYYLKNEQNPETVLPVKFKEDIVYGHPAISPSGDKLAYTSNEMGKMKIFLYDFQNKKRKTVLKRGVVIDTKTDYSYPLLAWHPTGKILAIVLEDKGMPWLYLYNIEKKFFSRQIIYDVQKITDISYSDNGQQLVVSAIKGGQSDVFVFNIAASSFDRLTNDIFSELNPRFINNSSQIIFSSNRLNDTLGRDEDNIIEVPNNFDLFVYDYANRSQILKRITNTTLADEMRPEPIGFNQIAYLSDENGIYNTYLASVDSTVSSVDTTIHYRYFVHSKAITDYSRNIIDENISTRGGKMAMVYYEDNLWKIYTKTTPDFQTAKSLSLVDTKFMASLKAEEEKKKPVAKVPPLADDSSSIVLEEKKAPVTQIKKFVMVYADSEGNQFVGSKQGGATPGQDGKGLPVLVNDEEKSPATFTWPKRLNYRVEYSVNDVTSQVDFNYINYGYQPFTGGGPIYLNPGFNVYFQIGLTDLMEDHRIIGGVRLNWTLVNNEYIFSYSNLKKRLDKEVVFHRNTIESEYYPYWKLNTHELFYILSWPFNEALSLRGTASYRNEMLVFQATDQITLDEPNRYWNWAIGIAQLVFDNTRNVGMNLYYGTRWKLFAEYHQLIDNDKTNVAVVGFDVRHYTKIHRTFIWANRIAGSASFGSDNLIYYMGGVDNWMFPEFNYDTPIDYSQHYAYQTLATNMRGFNQNIRNGNNFFIINSELRFPLFQYFTKTPLSSSFLRNFQLVGFGDIGTAWTGASPYSKENSLYTKYIYSGPLLISVEVQKEPIVGGFGFGARMHLLGYFLRGDMAWGVEDGKVGSPVYYFSLSLDF